MAGWVYGTLPSPPTNSPPIALDIWSFSDTTNWTSDSGFAPLSFTNITWSPIGSGKALVVDSTNAAWLRYRYIESDGTNEITVDKGTVMFWFAPNWTSTNQSSGPHQIARFIELGTYTTNASYGWWSIYCDQGGTNIYFAGQTNNGSTAVYLKAPISWTISNQWHHVALTYSSTNSALYLDGVLATNGAAVTYRPGPNILTNGFCIGSDSTGVAQVHGTIDDVETYNYVLDADTIAQLFNDTQMNYYLNPWNIANIASAPSTPTTSPVFEAITGNGYLNPIGTVSNCYVSSKVMLTNVIATINSNGTINLTLSLVGGSNSVYYDVFATASLKYPITNAVWAWMGQGYHCTTFQITNLGAQAAFLIAGSPIDSDNDGLTDAYENLVSHTDPQNPDTTGVGMSDGWQIAYLGYVGADPYAPCPSGDGWTIGQASQYGWDPRVFYIPPAPMGLTARYSGNGTTVNVSWLSSSGPVTSYTIQRYVPNTGYQLYQFTNVTSFPDTIPSVDLTPANGSICYQMQAHYGTNDSPWTDWVPIYKPSGISGTVVQGPQGNVCLAFQSIPSNTVALRITCQSWATLATTNFDVALSRACPRAA